MADMTMICTSCGRWDLLRETLESLIARNCGGVQFAHSIIIEGSGRQDQPEWWNENKNRYAAYFGQLEWIANEGRRGQIYSLDRAIGMVRTPWIFSTEDDWNFCQGNSFIADSQKILEKYPKISMVSLRGDDCNGHPNVEGYSEGFPDARFQGAGTVLAKSLGRHKLEPQCEASSDLQGYWFDRPSYDLWNHRPRTRAGAIEDVPRQRLQDCGSAGS